MWWCENLTLKYCRKCCTENSAPNAAPYFVHPSIRCHSHCWPQGWGYRGPPRRSSHGHRPETRDHCRCSPCIKQRLVHSTISWTRRIRRCFCFHLILLAEITHHRPLGHYILPGVGVALKMVDLLESSLCILWTWGSWGLTLDTHVNKNCVNVIRAVVPLEGSDVWPEIVSWKYQISFLTSRRIRRREKLSLAKKFRLKSTRACTF